MADQPHPISWIKHEQGGGGHISSPKANQYVRPTCHPLIPITSPGLNMNKVEVTTYKVHRLISMVDQVVILLSLLHLND